MPIATIGVSASIARIAELTFSPVFAELVIGFKQVCEESNEPINA